MARKKASGPPDDAIKISLTDDQKAWLETFLPDWASCVGPKGQVRGSAMEFVRLDIIDSFFDRFYANSPKEERDRMSYHGGRTVYWYLRGVNQRQTVVDGKGSKRIDVVNVWAKDRANEVAVEELYASYRQENDLPPGTKLPLEERRRLTCDAFRELPADVQSKYRDIAAGLKDEERKNKELTGEERIAYSQNFVSELLRFIRNGEQKAGVIVVANVAYEVNNTGALKVTSVATNSAKKYKKSNAHVDSLVNFGEHLRQASANLTEPR